MTRDGAPAAVGLVVGFKRSSDEQSVRRLVLVPESALSSASRDQLAVRNADGQTSGVDIARIDLPRIRDDDRAIEEVASAENISAALARERIAEGAAQPPVTILIVDESRSPQSLRELKALDGSCRDEGEEGPVKYVSVDQTGQSIERTLEQLSSDLARLGALKLVDCLGDWMFKGVVSSISGSQVETVELSKVAPALRLWTKAQPGVELMMRLLPPPYVSECPTSTQARSSARIGQSVTDQNTGELVLRVLDYPPNVDAPVSEVSTRTEPRLFDSEFPWDWGRRGDSNELFVLRMSAGDDHQFVFERFCKDNLAPRGRIVGTLGQGASISEDAGTEAENARFAIRLNNRVTLVSSPKLRHGLIVESFPEAAQLSRAGRVYFAEAASGGDLLIGHSRSRRMIYVAKLPTEGGEGGERVTTGTRPSLQMTAPRALEWQSNAFELAQLGWHGPRAQREEGGAAAGAGSGGVQMHVVGRSIAVLGNGGMAVLSLDQNDRPGIAINVDRRVPPAATGQPMDHLWARFSRGTFTLVASTIAQAPGTSNFSVVALYSERGGQDLLAMLSVVDGNAQPLKLIEVQDAIRSRIDRVGRTLDLGDERLYEPEPASGILVLGTSPSLDRFWGALIVNTVGQAGQPGQPPRDIDFAFAFNLHFWFNPFDRIWDFEAVGEPGQAQSLCQRFDFGRLNVISNDSQPRRVIAAVEAGCDGTPASTASAATRTVAIRDFLHEERIRSQRAP